MARHFGGHVSTLLGRWDGRWFVDVARHGYDTTLTRRSDGGLVNTNIVFFPALPYLIKGVKYETQKDFDPVMVCSECGEPVVAKQVHVHRGPGAKSPRHLPLDSDLLGTRRVAKEKAAS